MLTLSNKKKTVGEPPNLLVVDQGVLHFDFFKLCKSLQVTNYIESGLS